MAKVNKLPVLYIHIDTKDKDNLRNEAKNNGMQLTTYCRMVLLEKIRMINDTIKRQT